MPSRHGIRIRTLCLGGALLGMSGVGCDAVLPDFVHDVIGEHGSVGSQCNGSGAAGTGTGQSSSSGGTGEESSSTSMGSAESTLDTGVSTTTQEESCEFGEERLWKCDTCEGGEIPQRCFAGRWEDVQSSCDSEWDCTPGELYYLQYNEKFDCGATMVPYRCTQNCYRMMARDLPQVYVSRCKPTDCCGLAPGARSACLDPNDIPEGGNCQRPAPDPESVGKTWLTWEAWEKYEATLAEGNQNPPGVPSSTSGE